MPTDEERAARMGSTPLTDMEWDISPDWRARAEAAEHSLADRNAEVARWVDRCYASDERVGKLSEELAEARELLTEFAPPGHGLDHESVGEYPKGCRKGCRICRARKFLSRTDPATTESKTLGYLKQATAEEDVAGTPLVAPSTTERGEE